MNTDESSIIFTTDAIIRNQGTSRACVIPILQAIQKAFNYLPAQALSRVTETTEIPAALITEISTFYAQFRLEPAGAHFIKVCIGTACHVKGAEDVYQGFRNFLNIAENTDTDPDRVFTVEKVACLGCCMLAPAVQIDDITYGFVDNTRIPSILDDFLRSSQAASSDGENASESQSAEEIRICRCSSCSAGGSGKVAQACLEEIRSLGLPAFIRDVGCSGMSFQAPMIDIVTNGRTFRYGLVRPRDVRSILLRHFRPVRTSGRLKAAVTGILETIYSDENRDIEIRYPPRRDPQPDDPYLKHQYCIATEKSGELDPLDLTACRESGGFQALDICLNKMSAEHVCEIITRSGLRGRGGAGFPTGVKWSNVRKQTSDTKTLICNADEGDPGAFMDRMIIESFPFRVIEGILIAGFAVGAQEAVVYVRAEYPLAVQRLRRALELCEESNLIGSSILGSEFSLDIRVAEGAGAFVCGEETALIAAVEGKRGTPRFRPPYPSVCGLNNQPTLINNVETLSLVPWIIRHGADAFRKTGTEKSCGTKSFALAGKINRGGLIEVPMGMSIRQIVNDIGGGIQNGLAFKAVQIGGPSGGCVPASLAETRVNYEDLTAAGTMMGSGGMVVLDETDCMVDVARYFMSFTQLESCGKCTFCRIGTRRMLEILERLCRGQGKTGDIERLESVSQDITRGSLCGLGKTAPNPVLSSIRYFRDEYEAHLEGRCPAGKCKELIRFRITDSCIGCTKCSQNCPADAIPFTPYEQHEIDQKSCVRCGACKTICPEDAVVVESGRTTEKSEG